MFCRLASQYIHPKPTLYDQLVEGLKKYRKQNKVTDDDDNGDDDNLEKNSDVTVDVKLGGGK